MKHSNKVIMAVVILVAMLAFNTCENAGIRKDVEAAQETVAVDTSAALIIAQKDSLLLIARDSIKAFAARDREYAQRDRAAQRVVDSVAVLLAGYDTLIPRGVVETYMTASRSMNLSLREQMRQVSEQRNFALAHFRAAMQLNDSLGTLLTATQEQRDHFQRRAQPGLLESGRRALPWIALSVIVWEIVR